MNSIHVCVPNSPRPIGKNGYWGQNLSSDSTDSDGDTLTYTWIYEGDSEQRSGETIERTYPDGGDFYVNLLVTDSTGLTDEAETTVSVVEDYHGEASGDVDEGESDMVTMNQVPRFHIRYLVLGKLKTVNPKVKTTDWI